MQFFICSQGFDESTDESTVNLHCNMNNDSVIDKVEIVQFFLEIIQELFVIM